MSASRVLILVAAALGLLAIGWAASRIARGRETDGDTGAFWARVLLRSSILLGILCALSGLAPSISETANERGYHLFFDVAPQPWIAGRSTWLAALLAPVAVWGALLVIGLVEAPASPGSGRWIAGCISDARSRRWLLGVAAPFALLATLGAPRVGDRFDGYPAAAWSTLWMIACMLWFLAWSRAGSAPLPEPSSGSEEVVSKVAQEPWPIVLSRRGVEVDERTTWPERATERPFARDSLLAARLASRGARGVSSEIVEAIEGLVTRVGAGHRAELLLVAPDGAGQIETIAVAAELLTSRSREVTLIVVPRAPAPVADAIQRWLGDGVTTVAVGPDGNVPLRAEVWVVDAETLSERFLQRLSQPAHARRIGLLVWWDVHAYSGVLAANVWALSRRLHRLLSAFGRPGVRTLACVRAVESPDAQLSRFVGGVLSYDVSDAEVRVSVDPARPVHVHMVGSYEQAIGKLRCDAIAAPGPYATLAAALASVDGGWSTFLDRPADVTDAEWNAFQRALPAGSSRGAVLVRSPAEAGATLRSVEAGEVLSLRPMLSQSGRAAPPQLECHVALSRPDNPYAAYLLSSLGTSRAPAAKRLVCAADHRALAKRHLLLAIGEMEDTRAGLRHAALFNEQLLVDVLRELSDSRHLHHREVRLLGEDGRMQSDRLYRSARPPEDDDVRPLDTLGTHLVKVLDRAAGPNAVRRMVDRDRLGIVAYPGCVFMSRGRRYRVTPWSGAERDRLGERFFVECEPEDKSWRSYRRRNASIHLAEVRGETIQVTRGAAAVATRMLDVTYEEVVIGVLYAGYPQAGGPLVELDRQVSSPLCSSFRTRAVHLSAPPSANKVSLASLAQVLRDVLPVHVGVGEDDVEVVAIQSGPLRGLAIVDLFPDGIGLVEAFARDRELWLDVLENGRRWLAGCSCERADGCPDCIRSAGAEAADVPGLRQRDAALAAIADLLGDSARST